MKKVLIANRGEIALRVIRACREMGLATVVVYSDVDRGALHVLHAEEAYRLGPAPAAESYLRGDLILEIARRAGEVLKSNKEPGTEKQLIRNEEWDPYGFIGLCDKASAKSAGDPQVKLLREIQGIETEILLECWTGV